MLGIDTDSIEYATHKEVYQMFIGQKTEAKTPQAGIESLLIKDVYRTFSQTHRFRENPNTGQNKLFNVLKAYSLFDPDVGYTQGMSFIAAMILIVCCDGSFQTSIQDDEALAWTIFVKVLNISDWRRLYLYQTPKLFDLTKTLRHHLKTANPHLN